MVEPITEVRIEDLTEPEIETQNNSFTRNFSWQQVFTYTLVPFMVLTDILFLLPGLDASVRKEVFTALFYTGLLLSLGLGLVVSLTNPIDEYVKKTKEEKGDEIMVREFSCGLCRSFVKPKTRHCIYCNCCIENYDHHCKWLNNCIGGKNYRYFFYLLFASSIMAIAYSIEAFFVLEAFWQRGSMPLFWLHENPLPEAVLLGVVSVVTALMAVLLLFLTVFHVFLRIKGVSTFQFYRPEKITRHEIRVADLMENADSTCSV